ncbi:RNA polymerase sigma factor [Streptomyces sp. NPDC102381]|uniref:RNA polymerase sigma factor n=1 Tax=Streptomyces sp. NPDC102381 TaxID=3366164 RepID=UPI00381CEDDD
MTFDAGEAEGHADPRVAFYRDHHPRLVGYVHRRVHDKAEAEALAHETWLVFLRRFDHYWATYDAPVGPLFVIARRLISDWHGQRTPALLPGDDGLGAQRVVASHQRLGDITRAAISPLATLTLRRPTGRRVVTDRLMSTPSLFNWGRSVLYPHSGSPAI